MNILCRIDPKPPAGIKYMLGGESWLDKDSRSPRRLCCEEWGNLGPLELDSSIPENLAGFRVRITDIPAPTGAMGLEEINGTYFWTDVDRFGRAT